MAAPARIPCILVVDDEPAICWAFKQILEAQGWRALIASSAEEGLEAAEREQPDVVVLDVRLPGQSGLDALPRFRALHCDPAVLVMTAHGTMETAIEATRRGAFNHLIKPIHNDDAVHQIRTALERRILSREVARLSAQVEERGRPGVMAGTSPAMQEVYKRIGALAGAGSAVLILGESGTGKELVARALHDYSDRARGPFIAVNCAALPEALLESELYGHVKGAFTGAVRDKQGKAEAADGGTLFLDEIGELPLAIQAKLLRFLEQKTFERVGSTESVTVDVRILAATNVDLRARIKQQLFREDLYYRLNVVSIELPALRERRDDIPILAAHFLASFRRAGAAASAELSIGKDALAVIERYRWPGNVRELRNAIEHAAILARGVIAPEHLPAHVRRGDDSAPGLTLAELVADRTRLALDKCESLGAGNVFNEVLSDVEKEILKTTLRRVQGNQVKASALLGIHRTTLRKKIDDYDLHG